MTAAKMNYFKLCKRTISIFLLALCINIFLFTTIYSFSPGKEIRWIGQINTSLDMAKKKSFYKNLLNIVFGEQSIQLNRPISVYAKDLSKCWILDQGAKQIFYADINAGDFELLGNSGFHFHSLVGLCNGPQERLYLTDSRSNSIYQMNTETNTISILAENLKLNRPTGIAYSVEQEQIWLVETGKHRILVLDKFGNIIKSIGQRGTKPGEFNFPTFIWISASGKVYVVDSMNFRIQVFDDDGNMISVFGEAGDATGYLACPKGIATDSFENIYIVDALFHTVQIFDKEGNFLFNFGKQGREKGEFWMPSGIFIDTNNRIYIADSYNARIQIFELISQDENED